MTTEITARFQYVLVCTALLLLLRKYVLKSDTNASFWLYLLLSMAALHGFEYTLLIWDTVAVPGNLLGSIFTIFSVFCFLYVVWIFVCAVWELLQRVRNFISF